jgi:hypothetical protein
MMGHADFGNESCKVLEGVVVDHTWLVVRRTMYDGTMGLDVIQQTVACKPGLVLGCTSKSSVKETEISNHPIIFNKIRRAKNGYHRSFVVRRLDRFCGISGLYG